MASRRRIVLATTVVALVTGVVLCVFATRSPGPIYHGRTLDEWFSMHCWGSPPQSPQSPISSQEEKPEAALRAIGTNAVPFLTGRITRSLSPSIIDLCRWKLLTLAKQTTSRPITYRLGEAKAAATLLFDQIKPPGQMLVPNLESALRSTKKQQRLVALLALQGISSGHDLARPYIELALSDPDPEVQAAGADVVRHFGPAHGGWAVGSLSKLVLTRHSATFTSVLLALHCLDSNSLPALPLLEQRLATEQTQQTREFIAHSMRYISGFGP